VIPAVAGQTPDAAAATIQAAGLYPKISVKPVISGQAKGTVAYTVPAEGKAVSSGKQVVIYVSKGGTLTVPNVAGKSVADATSTLLAAGYAAVSAPQPSQAQFFVKSPTIPKGMVVGTDPAAGTAAPGTGAILLIISTGP
jgi:serine/threonine-protein kinase